MLRQELLEQVQKEIAQGQAAREAGNEGRARVCARRAAAIVTAEYLRQHGVDPGRADAYSVLSLAASRDDVPQAVREVLGHLLTRVEPGGRLPIQADLLAEARWLIDTLIPPGPAATSDEPSSG
ncbi:MAG TPA: hypothetical protein VGJ97_03555 [Anaerolineaceae bacterium]